MEKEWTLESGQRRLSYWVNTMRISCSFDIHFYFLQTLRTCTEYAVYMVKKNLLSNTFSRAPLPLNMRTPHIFVSLICFRARSLPIHTHTTWNAIFIRINFLNIVCNCELVVSATPLFLLFSIECIHIQLIRLLLPLTLKWKSPT